MKKGRFAKSRLWRLSRKEPELPNGVMFVPPGFQEVPDYRRPDYRYQPNGLTKESKKWRKALVRKDNEKIEGRLEWWNTVVERLNMFRATAKADWKHAANLARDVFKQMEESRLFTSVEMLQVVSAIATLEDLNASVSDKRGASKMVGEMFGVYNQRRMEKSGEKQEDIEVASGAMDESGRTTAHGVDLPRLSTTKLLRRLKGNDGNEPEDAAQAG